MENIQTYTVIYKSQTGKYEYKGTFDSLLKVFELIELKKQSYEVIKDISKLTIKNDKETYQIISSDLRDLNRVSILAY